MLNDVLIKGNMKIEDLINLIKQRTLEEYNINLQDKLTR